MQHLHAVILVGGGLVIAAPARDALAPLRGFFATSLAALALAWLLQGPTRPFHAHPLAAAAAIGATYGALGAVLGLVAPRSIPRALRVIFGIFCAAAGVLLMLFQLRILQLR